MIIGKVIRYLGEGVVSLGWKSDANPKKSKGLVALVTAALPLWLSDSTRIAVADSLTALADLLRAI